MKDEYSRRDIQLIGFVCALLGIILGMFIGESRWRQSLAQEQAYSVYDLNRDGKVNSYDGDICYDIFLGERIATPDMLDRADVTGDGLVDDADVVAIMDAILGKVEK